jgi:hypothetical protein
VQGCFFVAKVLTIAKRRDKMKIKKDHRRSVMNIFKKIFGIFKKKEKQEQHEQQEQQEPWFNAQSNHYDPKTGTPNEEAYISPDSIVIGLSDRNR